MRKHPLTVAQITARLTTTGRDAQLKVPGVLCRLPSPLEVDSHARSGSNGVDTVYFVDGTGKSCPTGVGLPEPGATLPEPGATLPTMSTPIYDATAGGTVTKKGVATDNPGLEPTNMCIPRGIPAAQAANATDASDSPFGIWVRKPHDPLRRR